jgi:cold shock CspA family protein
MKRRVMASFSRTAADNSAVERAGLTSLADGTKVSFELATDRGKESAVNLKVR